MRINELMQLRDHRVALEGGIDVLIIRAACYEEHAKPNGQQRNSLSNGSAFRYSCRTKLTLRIIHECVEMRDLIGAVNRQNARN